MEKAGKPEDHIRLVNEIAVLIEAGVSLSEAMDIASRSPVYQVFGDGLSTLGRDLRRGVSMPEAIRSNISRVPSIRLSADRSRKCDRHLDQRPQGCKPANAVR